MRTPFHTLHLGIPRPKRRSCMSAERVQEGIVVEAGTIPVASQAKPWLHPAAAVYTAPPQPPSPPQSPPQSLGQRNLPAFACIRLSWTRLHSALPAIPLTMCLTCWASGCGRAHAQARAWLCGCGIPRVLPPPFISHPADHVPCVLGKLMWPSACLGSRVTVTAAASFVCCRLHSYPILLAMCLACWAL